MKRRCYALLDRDGTIIVDRHYLAAPDGVELLPNALAGLRRLSEMGIGLVVVSNQSGIARGYFDQQALDAVNGRLRKILAAGGVELDGIYTCPHVDEDACACRKPKPGLALRAAKDLAFDLEQAFVIGDKACDIDLGRSVGARTILVRTGYGSKAGPDVEARADGIAADLAEAANAVAQSISGS
jgi:D-glycero-D-manno-heptose 1,7-bisphosphate phosphatase